MPSGTVFRGSSTVPCMGGRAVLGVAALVVAPLLAACSGSDGATARPSPSPTPISKLDAGAVRLARVEFCDRLPGAAVAAALGGKAWSHDSWRSGDPVPGAGGESGDVGHELGCAWTGADGATARAWVFARPVTSEFATGLVGQAEHQAGCTTATSPTFGNPALLQTCAASLPNGASRVRRAGLFGDTWLTCELTAKDVPTLKARTDTWCAAVVSAASAG